MMLQSSHTIGLIFRRGTDRQLLADFMREAGHEVVTRDPARPELRDLRGVSLILTDSGTARQHGEELMELKWQMSSSFLPVVVALPADVNGTHWLEAGFDEVLHLPVAKAELDARLSMLLRLHEQSERRYQAFFENALVGLYRITPEGRFLMANPALVQMLGYDSYEDLVQAGRESDSVGPSAHRTTFEGLAEKGEVTNLESSWKREDGSRLWVLESAKAVYDETGAVQYWEGTVEDITERKRAEEALREAKDAAQASNRAKSAFLANMSHEIRTPLTSIVGFTSFLAKQVSDDQLKFVKLIERSGQRLMDTLDALLKLAKLEANRAEVDFEVLKVEEEVDQIVQPFQTQAEQNGLQLALSLRSDGRRAHARLDSGALASILKNLVSNAITFTEEGSITVTVGVGDAPEDAQADGRHVYIAVEDTGPGIDPEFMPHIFETFKQESSGVGRSYEGGGLGLSIAKQLTELMDGAIEVESTVGEGSVFTVFFPLSHVTEQGGSSGGQRSSLTEVDNPRGRVLVLEDNEETQVLVESILEDVAAVTVCDSVNAAVNEAEQRDYDAVFVDINLGNDDTGLDFLNRLRGMASYVDVPVVAMTAFALPGNREELLAAGFSHYLSKPFTADELLELTSDIVS